MRASWLTPVVAGLALSEAADVRALAGPSDHGSPDTRLDRTDQGFARVRRDYTHE